MKDNFLKDNNYKTSRLVTAFTVDCKSFVKCNFCYLKLWRIFYGFMERNSCVVMNLKYSYLFIYCVSENLRDPCCAISRLKRVFHLYACDISYSLRPSGNMYIHKSVTVPKWIKLSYLLRLDILLCSLNMENHREFSPDKIPWKEENISWIVRMLIAQPVYCLTATGDWSRTWGNRFFVYSWVQICPGAYQRLSLTNRPRPPSICA